jgi:sterol desaturase/sphingolipid hydroxylase (fatty acid hydroxylase superfamily)
LAIKIKEITMDHPPIESSETPIRLFKSDYLEFFTHIHPIVIVIVWLPVTVYFFIQGISENNGKFQLVNLTGFFLGIFLWTIAEYVMHRFVFHFRTRTKRQERISFLFHGVHHAQPQSKTRLVMPLPVSIPLALLFFGLFYLVFVLLMNSKIMMATTFSGFIAGYLLYDLTHYATHHFPMRKGYFKYIKRYHMQHHYKSPNARFGVTSPLWDRAFGTYPD